MKKLGPQIKINIIAAISVATFAIFWVFLYIPSQKTIGDLKRELGIVQSQIRQIEGNFSGSGKLEQGILLLEKRYKEFNSKFPEKEEEALGALSDLAKQYKAEIRSVKSQPKSIFLDESGKKIEIEGKVCQTFLVSMEIRTSYGGLVEYIDALKELLPAYVTIESMHIRKEASGSLKLIVALDLAL
jgi:hypothetical protein